jgi:hypothetical protein
METNNQIDDAIYAACDEYPRDFTQAEMNYICANDTIKRVLLSWFNNELSHNCWTPQQRTFMQSLATQRSES